MLAIKELYRNQPSLNHYLFRLLTGASLASTAAVALIILSSEKYIIAATAILLVVCAVQAKIDRKRRIERVNEVLVFSLANLMVFLTLLYLFG